MPEPKTDDYCAETFWSYGLDSIAMVCSQPIVDGRCPRHGDGAKRLPVRPSSEVEALRAENAGLREALEAARPVVDAAVASIAAIRELTGGNLSSTWISQQTQVLAAAVDSYAQSSNPGEKS